MEIKRLLGDMVLVEPIEAEKTTAAGLILPTANQNTNLAKVIMVGPLVQCVKPGDTIQKFKQVIGIEFEKYLLLREGSEIEFIV